MQLSTRFVPLCRQAMVSSAILTFVLSAASACAPHQAEHSPNRASPDAASGQLDAGPGLDSGPDAGRPGPQPGDAALGDADDAHVDNGDDACSEGGCEQPGPRCTEPTCPATITREGDAWLLENDVLRARVAFAAGSIELTSFYSKEAEREYLSSGAPRHLFYLSYGGADLYANDQGWTLGQVDVREITGASRAWGQELVLSISRTTPRALTVTLHFELYDGRAGLRYQTFLRNDSDEKQTITESDVLALDFPNDPHVLHMAPLMKWHSTTGSLAPNKGLNGVCVYESGDGWAISPETNWKTAKLLPEMGSTTGARTPFAHINAWSDIPQVKVATNPESLQLVLFPHEEFEYIAVNLTAFAGDVIDGRMAMQEHFRKRFRYHDVSSVFFTNDWDWLGKRTEAYYRSTVIPRAKEAGLDMIMIDDLWNTTRDSDQAKATFTNDLEKLSDDIVSEGLRFGIWFSMTGGGHNEGRDLADPAQIEAKRKQVEDTLIAKYNMTHQMIDLTEFWPNNAITPYSHPSDSVYRKNVLVRNFVNGVVERHPDYVGKLTSEVDIWPTRADRNNGLLHVTHNGFVTANGAQNEYSPGAPAPMKLAYYSFGLLPMESVYFGGSPTGKMGQYYGFLLSRYVKFNTDPGTWEPVGIKLLNKFNTWRKSPRIRAMTEEITRPLHAGPNFDPVDGPYAWMYTTERKDRALLIATAAMRDAPDTFAPKVRWLDPQKTYLIEDISMEADRYQYKFIGRFTGAELRSEGFTVDLASHPSRGKAYWLEEDRGSARQVVYADEHVRSYSETIEGSRLTVDVTGTRNASAELIVFDRVTSAALVESVTLDDAGAGRLVLE